MRYLLKISARARPGRDEEYNAWYDSTHIHEILALPGFKSAERFVHETQDGGQPEYVTLYEIESDDPQATLQAMFTAAPTMKLTDSIDMESAQFEILRPLGSGVVHRDGAGTALRLFRSPADG